MLEPRLEVVLVDDLVLVGVEELEYFEDLLVHVLVPVLLLSVPELVPAHLRISLATENPLDPGSCSCVSSATTVYVCMYIV